MTIERGVKFNLECFIYDVLTPLTLQWIANDKIITKEKFESSGEHKRNVSLSTVFKLESSQESITCAIHGNYLHGTNMSVLIMDKKESVNHQEESKRDVKAIYVAAALLLFGLIMTAFVSSYVKISSRTSQQNKRWSNNLHMEDNVCYETAGVDIALASDAIKTGNMLRQSFVADPESSLMFTTKPVLETRIKHGHPFEYWTAFISTKDSIRYPCFAKVLGANATIGDYETLKTLVPGLTSLQRNSRFVQIIHTTIQTNPFAIFYELLNYGTLDDFIRIHYRKETHTDAISEKLSNVNNSMLKNIFAFGTTVVEAIEYLMSLKFCHPTLTMRKILMTSNGSCKLYDIYPIDMGMSRIKQLLKKDNPPFAWMATETLILERYLPKSEIWNIAVFLWQLISLGEFPVDSV